MLENPEHAAVGAHVDLPVGHERRSPDGSFGIERPVARARVGIEAVKPMVVTAHVDEPVGNRHGGRASSDFWIRPDAVASGDIAAPTGFEAHQDALAVVVEGVLGGRHIDAVVVEHGIVENLVALAAKPVFDRHGILSLGGRMAVGPPGLFNGKRAGRNLRRLDRGEAIKHAVACALEDADGIADLGEHWAAPLAVDDVFADTEIVASHQPARLLVQNDQRRGRRVANPVVGAVHAVGRAHVQVIAEQEHGTVNRIMRLNAQLADHVVGPDHVGGVFSGFDGVSARWNHPRAFVEDRAIVSVGHAVQVEAEHFAPIRNDIDQAVLDHWRGGQSDPVEIAVANMCQLGHNQLPEEIARLLVEAHQHSGVVGEQRIAGHVVVRAHEHASLGDDRRAVGLPAELGDPLDVRRQSGASASDQGAPDCGLKRLGQPFFR